MLRLSKTDLDCTPDRWAEELALALAGYDAAIEVLRKREARKLPDRRSPDGTQPVYGMPGRRFQPGKGLT